MSSRESTLKEKFRIALTSTAKVISDDFDLNKKVSEKNKSKDTSSIEIDNINSPSDFIKLRAETDSSALKKNFLMMLFIKKIYQEIILQDHFTISQKK
jgi:cobaltochelatase CobT